MEDEAGAFVVWVRGANGILNKSTDHATIQTDAYIMAYDNRDRHVFQSDTFENSIKPKWDEPSGSFTLETTNTGATTIQVWHRGFAHLKHSDEFLGEFKLENAKLFESGTPDITAPLRARIKEPDLKIKNLANSGALGTITVSWKAGKLEESQLGKTMSLDGEVYGHLEVKGCSGLLKRDPGEKALSDPYITVRYPENMLRWRSEVVPNTLNPVFAAQKPVPIRLPKDGRSTVMRFRAWNANPKPQRDNFLGEAAIDIRKLHSGDHRLELKPRVNEQDTTVKKLEGRLGWVTFSWKLVNAADEPKDADTGKKKKTISETLAEIAAGTTGEREYNPATYNSRKKVVKEPEPERRPPSVSQRAVTVSDVVPLCVQSEDGREFLTSIAVNAPLRSIQSQITDFFAVCPTSQVLMYNRQQVNVDLSLQENGALLMKGEPHVKIRLATAKGIVIALICQIYGGKEVPISVPETATIADVKSAISVADGVTNVDPKKIRLLWHYNELNDRATVEYYKLTSGSRVQIVKRPTFGFEGQEFTSDDVNRRNVAEKDARERRAQLARPAAQRGRPGGAPAQDDAYRPNEAMPRIVGDSSMARKPVERSEVDRPWSQGAPKPRQPRPKTAGRTRPVSAPSKNEPSVPVSSRPASGAQHGAPPRAKGYYEKEKEDAHEFYDADLAQIQATISKTKAAMSALTSSSDGNDGYLDRQAKKLEGLLNESQERHNTALARIEELEATLKRYRALAHRAADAKK